MNRLQGVYSELRARNDINKFLKNFSVLFGFRSIGIVLNLFVTILGARLLNISELGQYNVAINCANLLVIPLVFGVNTTLLKYLPENNKQNQGIILGTVYIGNFLLGLLISIIFLVLLPFISTILKLSYDICVLILLTAIACNICIVIETILRYQQNFASIGKSKLIGAASIFILYLLSLTKSYFVSVPNFLIYNLLGQGLISIFMLFKLQKYKLQFKWHMAKKIYTYSFLNMLTWLFTTALYSMDLYLLSYFTTYEEVGIFSVYEVMLRNYFSIFFNDIFAAVFIPTLVELHESKQYLYKKAMHLMPIVFIVLFIGTSIVSCVLIYAYGTQYTLNLMYVVLVAIGIGLHGIYLTLSAMLILDGVDGAKVALWVLGKPFVIFIAITAVLIYSYGLVGAFIAFIVNQIILICRILKFFKRQ